MKKFLLSSNTTIQKELYAGLTTFLTMSYIILANPSILSTTGMSNSALITTTILVSTVGCVLMGLLANLPFAIAPGMGLNAFFAFSLVSTGMFDWQNALGIVFISGILFVIISLLKIREMIAHAVPLQLRYGISGGIGLLIAFIGMQWSGFIVPHPATFVTFGGLNPKTIVFIIGIVIMTFLVIKKVPGATVLGIIITSVLATLASLFIPEVKNNPLIIMPKAIFALPDFSLLGSFRFNQVFTWAAIIPLFSFLFIDFFDSFSTFFGLAEVGNCIDSRTGMPKNMKQAFLADAITTTFSGFAGSSPGTAYIESASGIREGGKTGLTAITTGILFLPFMFLSPLLVAIPQVAIAPVLVLVGIYMMAPLIKTDWHSLEIALPSFLALILTPLTFSLSIGISCGILSYTLIKLLMGKGREISAMLWIITIMIIVALAKM